MIAKKIGKERRHERIRKQVSGTADRPRLSVYRSLNNVYAQIIDDSQAQTLASASSMDKEIRKTLKSGGNVAAAKAVGKALAERAKQGGVTRVVFDRGGYAYHGRIKELADADPAKSPQTSTLESFDPDWIWKVL